MQKLRAEKGITLIALIITIIVMLILVGVSVTVALNGGLFTTAKEAAEGTASKRNEELNLSDGKVEINGQWYNSIDEYVNGNESGNEETTLAAGLYNDEGVMKASWSELESKYGFDITKSVSPMNYTEEGTMYYVLNNNDELADVTKIVIDDSLTSIPQCMFISCSNITSIIIPNTVTTIGTFCFYETGLKELVLPESVTKTENQFICSCPNIESVYFPKSVTYIECPWGESCPKLTINYEGTEEEWKNIGGWDEYGPSTGGRTVNYNYVLE